MSISITVNVTAQQVQEALEMINSYYSIDFRTAPGVLIKILEDEADESLAVELATNSITDTSPRELLGELLVKSERNELADSQLIKTTFETTLKFADRDVSELQLFYALENFVIITEEALTEILKADIWLAEKLVRVDDKIETELWGADIFSAFKKHYINTLHVKQPLENKDISELFNALVTEKRVVGIEPIFPAQKRNLAATKI